MQKRWLSWALATLVVCGLVAVWKVRAARDPGPARTVRARPNEAQAALRDPHLREVLRLLRRKDDPKSWNELVALYGRLAGDPSALAARSSALNALFSEPALPLRLKRVLDAVEADPTPASEDPLWSEIVQGLAQQWSGPVFDQGRDLMLLEKRQRVRQALVASFTELVGSEHAADLSQEQSQGLLADLIDLHAQAAAEQRPQIEQAVRRLGGNDPADLLAGQGLGKGKKLELQAEYEKNLRAGVETLLKDQPAEVNQ
jgi:hypothetical protein